MAARIDATSPFKRLFPVADVDQDYVGAHALQTVEEVAHIADVLVLHDHPVRQAAKARLHAFQEVAVFDGQSDGQRVHEMGSDASATSPAAYCRR